MVGRLAQRTFEDLVLCEGREGREVWNVGWWRMAVGKWCRELVDGCHLIDKIACKVIISQRRMGGGGEG